MADVAKMLDTGCACITTHPAVDIVTEPRKLSDQELETIKAWHDKKTAQLLEQRGDLYVAERNLATLARTHHDEAMHAHAVTQRATKDAAEALKVHISEELTLLRPKPTKKEKLVGLQVKASGGDDVEMGDSTFEICHVEAQTWADGEKHTVCIIKAEGKPTLSREFSTLTIHDPFISRDAAQAVRVVVIPHDVEHAQFFAGWRGIVQAAKASAPSVKVNFPLLKMGKIVHAIMMVPRTALEVLVADDISMLPNTHPWLGRRVTTLQTGQAGEIVDVNRGRVKIALEDSEPKKTAIFIESKGFSFEALFAVQPEAEEAAALPDPPQAKEAQPQLAAEAPPQIEHGGVASVADSDAESDHPASARHGSDEEEEEEEEEPVAPKRRGIKPAKAAVVKSQAAGSDEESKPAPKRRAKQSAKAAVVENPAAGSAEETKLAPKRRTGKQPARAAVVKTPAAGSDEEPKPAPKRKGKESAQAAPKRRRKSSVDVD
jgi:hypothetical protein